MPFRYVPLLRSKAGEATALQQLTPLAKQRIFPIIHLVASPTAAFVPKLARAWPQLPLAVDGMYNFGITGATNSFTDAMTALRHAGVLAVPSVECDADTRYVTAVKRFVNQQHPFLVVKASLSQLVSLPAWVAGQNWNPGNVDLVITAGHVADYSPGFENYVTHELRQHFQGASPWRKVTLASSAAPKDHSRLQLGRNTVTRLDWQLWQRVHHHFAFQIDYGDYGISHPDLDEPPGVAMARATVSVRYTVDNDWIILKGNPTTGARGQDMASQYLRHARTLQAEAQFGGLTGCQGDLRIIQIAGQAVTSGNRTTWVEISANRHLSLVATRLP